MLDPALLANALAIVLEPWNVLILVLGVVFGIVVGIIPGLSSTMAVALLIPFTFTMQAEAAMSLLVAVFVGGISGGAVTAILIRMPGTPASVATTLDGFPMAQKGLGGQAIGHAAIASMIGTAISGVFLVITAPLLAAFALKFYFADYVAVCVFALTAVIAVTGDRLIRGVVTATIGLLAATFGISAEDGMPRFDFGVPSMMSGVDLIPALIGFFAISQIMHEVAGSDRPSFDNDLRGSIGRVLPRLAEVRRNTVNYIRSALIGTVVGVIPAVGGGPAGLIAYAQEKNSSKDPKRYGSGIPEGVIASEAANNATVGGALIIALTLGIPGDAVTAVLLGGLMIHGLQPGSQLFVNSPTVVYSIYFSVFFGSIVMAVVLLLSVRWLARVVEVPKRILMPVLFILACSGVFALNNRMFDVLVMCAFGLLGYIFDRFRYPLPPFVLGLLLGPLIEGNFRKMVGADGNAWALFTRPLAVTFLLLAAGSIVYSLVVRHRRARDLKEEATG